MKKVEWYTDFLDHKHRPSKDELVAVFKVRPARGFSLDEAAGRVASESSVGTWTTLTNLTKGIRGIMARAYREDGHYVFISYPMELFEPGNMPQVMSSIAGNVFSMKALKSLRLVDVSWPEDLVRSFRGPGFGRQGIRSFMKVPKRPLTASVPKPKLGLTYEEHALHGYEAWVGGLDLLKDDENLTSQGFNPFDARARETFRLRDKAERETGERKSYLINVTAETSEMMRRAKLVKDLGGEYIMIDVLTAGWAALQTLREAAGDLGLAIHAHRAFHGAFTRNPNQGMTMEVVAEICRLIGVDQLHIGTAVGKLEASKAEVRVLEDKITSPATADRGRFLGTDWFGRKAVFPVCSGGLHVGLLPQLFDILGTDIVVQLGGGIWGHPAGGRAGAKALRDAIDAYQEGIPLREYASKSPELGEALRKWGTSTFK